MPAFLVLVMAGAQGEVCGSSQMGNGPVIETCTDGPTTLETVAFSALMAFLVIAPVVTAIHLGRRLRPDAHAAASA